MPADLKQKTCLIYDHGLWTALAERLARDDGFGRVLYFSEFNDVAPRFNKFLVGAGLENVTRVKSFWRALPDADLVIFTDVGDGGLQEYLRALGIPVFGCFGAEELELYRWEARQVFNKLGIQTPKGELITGLSALRDHLCETEDKWVKLAVGFRGSLETFHHETYRLSESTLDDFAMNVGPAAEFVEFVVDDPIDDAVECGGDHIFSGGRWSDLGTYGYEVKDGSYAAHVCDLAHLPEPVQYVNGLLTPLLAQYGYCGPVSTEIRQKRDGPPILLELTCRPGSPPWELWLELWKNLPQMIYAAVTGSPVEGEPADQYGAEIIAYSDWSDTRWTALDVPSDARRWFKFCFAANIGGYPQIVPQHIGWGKAGAVLGIGSSWQEASRLCARNAGLLKGKGIECPPSALDDATEVIDRGRKFGLDF